MDDLESLAQQATSLLPADELHGLTCGMACAAANQPENEFPIEAFIDLVGTDALTDGLALRQFINASLTNLFDEDLGFKLLVVADDHAMRDRVESLAAWCGGFLSGFAGGLQGARAELPVDVQEVLKDLAALAAMEVDEEEQDEDAYTEIYEYLRVSTQLSLALMADQE
ncbi:MAG TPA: hypothetical protein DER02_04050 [Gammaproteobacteria bacterium]|nr:hypothetical protein [Gammaproteobacteria bacterium]|tara:strand:+ start:189 stop:695 length:507 start_codon:yes stop_codon:yes gene_type:complete